MGKDVYQEMKADQERVAKPPRLGTDSIILSPKGEESKNEMLRFARLRRGFAQHDNCVTEPSWFGCSCSVGS